MSDHHLGWPELDLNPVITNDDGIVPVDVRIVLAHHAPEEH